MASKTKKTFVKVRLHVNGLHRWPGACGKVCYLKEYHRHTFIFTVVVEVEDSDRAVEFITLKTLCKEHLSMFWDHDLKIHNFEYRSCEMLAEHLGDALLAELDQYNVREVSCSEDGEFEGVVQWQPITPNS